MPSEARRRYKADFDMMTPAMEFAVTAGVELICSG
jgi:hypothetical protein